MGIDIANAVVLDVEVEEKERRNWRSRCSKKCAERLRHAQTVNETVKGEWGAGVRHSCAVAACDSQTERRSEVRVAG